MNYEQEILFILEEAGSSGLSLRKIAHHVYNSVNGLFEVVTYEQVYRSIVSYIYAQTKHPDGTVKSTGSRGKYCLNIRSTRYIQTMLDFTDGVEEKPEPIKPVDTSLSLFD